MTQCRPFGKPIHERSRRKQDRLADQPAAMAIWKEDRSTFSLPYQQRMSTSSPRKPKVRQQRYALVSTKFSAAWSTSPSHLNSATLLPSSPLTSSGAPNAHASIILPFATTAPSLEPTTLEAFVIALTSTAYCLNSECPYVTRTLPVGVIYVKARLRCQRVITATLHRTAVHRSVRML